VKLIEQNAYVYICGAMNMGKDVQKLLEEIVGKDTISDMEKEKRFIKELWTS
jgi:sulfite reductase alpha subunit-like flavoprotein